jgi:xanthine dehydrogenase accessory factor
MKNIYLQFLDPKHNNKNLVLATVTVTTGSTPQKPGSSAIFSDKGLITGTVGGGVVEKRVEEIAIKALKSGNSGYFTFDLDNDIDEKTEAICGGQISVLIDARPANSRSVFEMIGESIGKNLPVVLITMVTRFSEEAVLINRYCINADYDPPIPAPFLEKIKPVANDMIAERRLLYREMELAIPDKEPSSIFFLEAVFPPAHLVIAGAGHIGRALAHLADMIDFRITVIDDRKEYANADNIPEADNFIIGNIGKAVEEIVKDDTTYIVIVTRGHANDAEALQACINAEPAYIGMIGSKKKISSMRSEFLKNGWATPAQWNRIFSPIGLEIGSKTVGEIAVSIAAQLIAVRSRN